MLEIVFNELSHKELADSKQHTHRIYDNFFSLIDRINSLKIAPVRLRSSLDLANISISEEYYTLKDWLKTLPNEARQRYLGYISQDPILTDNPYFTYKSIPVIGFGYGFINDLTSVSYSTNNVWIEDNYKVQREYLPSDYSDIIIDEVTVRHCVLVAQSVSNRSWITQSYIQKQSIAVRQLESFDAFWEKRILLFQWLEFASCVREQIKVYGSVNDSAFKKVVRYLMALNQHLVLVNNGEEEFAGIPGDVSNDGETTMKKFGEERTFVCPDGQEKTFSLHVKLGDVRIYLYPKQEYGKYIVGYIGKHLRTKNFN